jgi:hypothetical protein
VQTFLRFSADVIAPWHYKANRKDHREKIKNAENIEDFLCALCAISANSAVKGFGS